MLQILDENTCMVKMLSQNNPNMTLKGLYLALERKDIISNKYLIYITKLS